MKLEFTGRYDEAQRNFDRIEQTVSALGLKVNGGASSATWAASNTSPVVTVNHGLGRTPVAVSVVFNCIGSGQQAYAFVNTPDSTSFQVQGRAEAAFSGLLGFYWIAVG